MTAHNPPSSQEYFCQWDFCTESFTLKSGVYRHFVEDHLLHEVFIEVPQEKRQRRDDGSWIRTAANRLADELPLRHVDSQTTGGDITITTTTDSNPHLPYSAPEIPSFSLPSSGISSILSQNPETLSATQASVGMEGISSPPSSIPLAAMNASPIRPSSSLAIDPSSRDPHPGFQATGREDLNRNEQETPPSPAATQSIPPPPNGQRTPHQPSEGSSHPSNPSQPSQSSSKPSQKNSSSPFIPPTQAPPSSFPSTPSAPSTNDLRQPTTMMTPSAQPPTRLSTSTSTLPLKFGAALPSSSAIPKAGKTGFGFGLAKDGKKKSEKKDEGGGPTAGSRVGFGWGGAKKGS